MNWYKLAEAALNITPDQFQAMGWEQKWRLARNESISLSTQKMFFTEEYSDKNEVLKILFDNPSFLKGVTLQEMREFTKTKEARLHVYRKRLKAVKEKILL